MAVPKKRLNKSKTRTRKNIWKRRAREQKLRALANAMRSLNNQPPIRKPNGG
uniref:Ribosomal protein L32 n=1 Tax=Pseudobryopsis hainanensis TaxID=2320808 RepID=A0A3S7SZN3_9CHLO|nr:ribosomal protein L32 [Pseudobryopsis hainanensis]